MFSQYLFAFILYVQLSTSSLSLQKLSTRYFDFYFEEREKELVTSLARQADVLAEELMSFIGVYVRDKVCVYIVSDTYFQQVQPGRKMVPEWASGVAYPRLSLMVLKSPGSLGSSSYNVKRTFIHELSHIILGSAGTMEETIPRWLNEGIAMYMSGEWDLNRVVTMTQAVLTDELIPLGEMVHSFPLNERKAELAYCQSFYLISFMVTTFGKEKFHQFVAHYSQQRSLEEALFKAYGLNLSQLETQWHDYLVLRFSWIPLVTSSSTIWFLVTIIFLIGYIRKKYRASLTVRQWEKEM